MILQQKPIITGRGDKNVFESANKQTGEEGSMNNWRPSEKLIMLVIKIDPLKLKQMIWECQKRGREELRNVENGNM